MRKLNSGFTLVELVMTIVILGVLAVVAIPRFFDNTFKEAALHDEIVAAVQHARRMAVAGRHFVCVNVTAGTGAAGIVELRRDTTALESVVTVSCSTSATGVALALPARGRDCPSSAPPNQICAPSGVVLGGSSLIFDPLGRVVSASRVVPTASPVTVGTVSNQTAITVVAETGYVQ